MALTRGISASSGQTLVAQQTIVTPGYSVRSFQIKRAYARSNAALSASASQVVPLMVHEAVVNALRHARPSWVAVDVRLEGGHLHLAVSNDGRGFPFRGLYDQIRLKRARVGPVSLRERVTSLGGTLTIDSRDAGSIIEIALPMFHREGADADPISGRR